MVVIPRRVSDSDDFGHLSQAPYGVGGVALAPGTMSLKVKVLQKFGTSYNL